MSQRNHIPATVSAQLEARLAPFGAAGRDGPGDLDVGTSNVVAARKDDRRLRRSFVNDLKLLFAALGAGGSVVPLGDNGRTTRLLSQYAASLCDH